MLPTPDPEFALLLATLHWPDDSRRHSAITRAATGSIDWKRFLALVNRHRVGPLAAQGLASARVMLPRWLSEQTDRMPQRAAFAEMAMAAELVRLQRLLIAEGIATIALKGPALSLRAFGKFGLRTYRDLDLLIPDTRLGEACAVLEHAGYRVGEPAAAEPDATDSWRKNHKDLLLIHRDTGFPVELHWRLFDNRTVMPLSHLPADVALGFAPLDEIQVLPIKADLAYLCVHGAMHGWSRLKWLADVNALLATIPGAALTKIVATSTGSSRVAVAQALILCRDLLGASFPAVIDGVLSRSVAGRLLARLAWAQIRRSGVQELEQRRFATTVKNLSHYALLRGGRSWLEELRFDFNVTPRDDGGAPRGQSRVRGWIARHLSPRECPSARTRL